MPKIDIVMQYKMIRIWIAGALFCAMSVGICAEDLMLTLDDIAIDQSIEGGFLLRVRKRPDIGSVLLTESTRDPNLQDVAYGLRAKGYYPINGDERRILDNQFIDSDHALYFLLDSSTYPDEQFGEAFHIFIPYVVEYGYPWTRNGDLLMHDGAFINIRVFEKQYADYSGAFSDNPYIIRVVQREREIALEVPVLNRERFSDQANTSFTRLAAANDGEALVSSGNQNLLDTITDILAQHRGQRVDVVFVLDTTSSMRNDINVIKKKLVDILQQLEGQYIALRVGLVLYRDYDDEYLTRVKEFEEDTEAFSSYLAAIEVGGGNDTPEAVFEALYAALQQFNWSASTRQIILIGDAPPHSLPRADIDERTVEESAKSLGVAINTILLPK